MTAATYAEMKKLKKQLDKDPKNPATLSLMLAETNRIVWKNMLKTISQDENRGKELVKLIQKINQADKKTKIVIFAPYDCGAYDIALKALQSHCVEGFDVDDDKKIHFWHEMYHATEGYLAATNELLSLHIDLTTRRVGPMAPEIAQWVEKIQIQHSKLPLPSGIGRLIGMKRPST